MTISLDRQEAINILEEIARQANNAAARIAAIRQLEEMRSEEEGAGVDGDLYPEDFVRHKGPGLKSAA